MYKRLCSRKNKQLTYQDFWEDWLTNEVMNLFEFTGIPSDMETGLKLALTLWGCVAFFRYNGEVCALDFQPGGKVGLYPVPYEVIITSPVIHDKLILTPHKDCETVYCFETDIIRGTLSSGFYPLIWRTAKQLSDNDISIDAVQFNKRLPTIFTARTDTEYTGMKMLLDDIKKGVMSIIARDRLGDSVNRLDAGETSTRLQEFTEYQQYVIGNFFNMIGVNATWNMKRERVTSTETEQNDETTRYNMVAVIERLKRQFNAVNNMFGTNYGVRLNVEKIREKEVKTNDNKEVDDTS